MKWWKHESNLRYTPALKRIIRKHGLEGYGLYIIIMEMFTELEKKPDLAKVASEYNINLKKVVNIASDIDKAFNPLYKINEEE